MLDWRNFQKKSRCLKIVLNEPLFDRPIGIRYTLRFCVRQGHLVILSSSSEKFSHDQLSDQEVGKWQQQSQSSQQQSLILDQMLYEETITTDYYFFLV